MYTPATERREMTLYDEVKDFFGKLPIREPVRREFLSAVESSYTVIGGYRAGVCFAWFLDAPGEEYCKIFPPSRRILIYPDGRIVSGTEAEVRAFLRDNA